MTAQTARSDPLLLAGWPRTTERLVIRRATAHDAHVALSLRRREEVSRWLTELPTDLDTYRNAFALPERLATTLVVEREGHVIGDLMLRVARMVVIEDAAHDVHLDAPGLLVSAISTFVEHHQGPTA